MIVLYLPSPPLRACFTDLGYENGLRFRDRGHAWHFMDE